MEIQGIATMRVSQARHQVARRAHRTTGSFFLETIVAGLIGLSCSAGLSEWSVEKTYLKNHSIHEASKVFTRYLQLCILYIEKINMLLVNH